MNYTQIRHLNQITPSTLIVGVDVSKRFHIARAQDYRGQEFGKHIKFLNTNEGFKAFAAWFESLMKQECKTSIVVGMEPTGPYWINLARYLNNRDILVVTVNPHHVKKSKELDDNNQSKNDVKDARVIAQLVKDARFSEPNFLDGPYEELRNAKNLRRIMISDLTRNKNRIQNWLDRFFPEWEQVYARWEAKSFVIVLKRYTFPEVIAKQTASELYESIQIDVKRGFGKSRIDKLIEVCKMSIGLKTGYAMGAEEIKYLLSTHERLECEIQLLDGKIETLCSSMDEVKRLMEINGIALTTATGIISELGDIRKYKDANQVIKMAGLSLIENSSGEKKGRMSISKRGRKDLRKTLYQAMLGMIRTNHGFRMLFEYYTMRTKNQLTGKQALVALMRKLLRIIHAIITKGQAYDEIKMLSAINHPVEFIAA